MVRLLNVGVEMIKKFVLLLSCFALIGCAVSQGVLGTSDIRRVVVLGEHVDKNIVHACAEKYDAAVFYSLSSGPIANLTSKALSSTAGPSGFMRRLMNEFRSISNTSGNWEFIVPNQAERYFLVTLRNMEDNAVTNARGTIYFPESNVNEAITREVARVFGDGFNVSEKKGARHPKGDS